MVNLPSEGKFTIGPPPPTQKKMLLRYAYGASLARSFTHAGKRCSSAAMPALHDPSLMQVDAAHLS